MKKPIVQFQPKMLAKNLTNLLTKYLMEHQSAVLTGSSIVFNAAGIMVTYRNSPEIHNAIYQAKVRLSGIDLYDSSINAVEERKKIYRETFIEVSKLTAPIIIFFTLSTTASIVNQKKQEAKIAALTAALSVAQNTISEYSSFKNEVRKEVGEEQYQAIVKEVSEQEALNDMKNKTFHAREGEKTFYIPYVGCYFSTTSVDKVTAIMENTNRILRDNDIKNSYGKITRDEDGNPITVIYLSDVCKELGVEDDSIPEFAYNLPFRAKVNDPVGSEIEYYIGSMIDRYGELVYSLFIRPDLTEWVDSF